MEDPRSIWESRYSSQNTERFKTNSDWLNKWSHLFEGNNRYALDVGSGIGTDTKTLIEFGFEVTAIDFSDAAIKQSEIRNPKATHFNRDLSKGLGTFTTQYSVTVANLSLHYFAKDQTAQIIRDIHAALEKDGIFIFRVNSKEDRNYGAPEGLDRWTQIQVNGVLKQFFDKQMITKLLDGYFDIHSLKNRETNRFGKTKKLIECVAKKT